MEFPKRINEKTIDDLLALALKEPFRALFYADNWELLASKDMMLQHPGGLYAAIAVGLGVKMDRCQSGSHKEAAYGQLIDYCLKQVTYSPRDLPRSGSGFGSDDGRKESAPDAPVTPEKKGPDDVN